MAIWCILLSFGIHIFPVLVYQDNSDNPELCQDWGVIDEYIFCLFSRHFSADPWRLPISRYRVSYPGTKFCTQVQRFVPRYTVSYPGTKIRTQIQRFVPRYKGSYPDTKFHTKVQRFVPTYKDSYPGTKFRTQIQRFVPRYKVSYPGENLFECEDLRRLGLCVDVYDLMHFDASAEVHSLCCFWQTFPATAKGSFVRNNLKNLEKMIRPSGANPKIQGNQICEFLDIGRFLKITDVAQIFFLRLTLCIFFTKMGLATLWVICFTNSSGHPDRDVHAAFV
jgi:hypothetical protein